jgi:hypothetical protein
MDYSKGYQGLASPLNRGVLIPGSGSGFYSEGYVGLTQPVSNAGITGTPAVGQVLTAPTYPGALLQWKRNGIPIPGAMGQTYTVQSVDAGCIIGYGASLPITNSGGGNVVTNGFVAPGATFLAPDGTPMTVGDGDDFTSAIPFFSGLNNSGYIAARSYMLQGEGATVRDVIGGTTIGLIGRDLDPVTTGFMDANRGAPVPSYADAIVQGGTSVILKSRLATATDKLFMNPASPRPIVSAMLNTSARSIAKAPFLFRVRTRWLSALGAGNEPRGSHRSDWWKTIDPSRSNTGAEYDNEEYPSQYGSAVPNLYSYINNASTVVSGGTTPMILNDGPFHILDCKVDIDTAHSGHFIFTIYRDSVIVSTLSTFTLNATNMANQLVAQAIYLLFTNHVTASDYVASDWTAAGVANYHEIDYWMLAAPTSGYQLITPTSQPADVSVAWGANFSVTYPTTSVFWNGSAGTDILQQAQTEENDPGGNLAGGHGTTGNADGIPTGTAIIYSAAGAPTFYAGSRGGTGISAPSATQTTAPYNGKAGRINLSRGIQKQGAVTVVSNFAVNVGPCVLRPFNPPPFVQGTPYSYTYPYKAIDIGNITSPSWISSGLGWGWSVTGLPAGLTASTNNGDLVISGTPTAASGAFTSSTVVTRTNALGQTAATFIGDATTTSGGLANVADPPIVSGLILDINPDNAASVTSSGGLISSISGSNGTTYTATQATGSLQPSLVLAGTTGRNSIQFGGTQYLSIAAAFATSFAAGQDYTLIAVAEVSSLTASQSILDISLNSAASTASRLSLLQVTGTPGSFFHRKCDTSVESDGFMGQNNTVSGYGQAANTPTLLLGTSQGTGGQPARLNVNHSSYGFVASPTPVISANYNSATIGARFAASAASLFLTGKVHRLLAYNRALVNDERLLMAEWSTAGYGTA